MTSNRSHQENFEQGRPHLETRKQEEHVQPPSQTLDFIKESSKKFTTDLHSVHPPKKDRSEFSSNTKSTESSHDLKKISSNKNQSKIKKQEEKEQSQDNNNKSFQGAEDTRLTDQHTNDALPESHLDVPWVQSFDDVSRSSRGYLYIAWLYLKEVGVVTVESLNKKQFNLDPDTEYHRTLKAAFDEDTQKYLHNLHSWAKEKFSPEIADKLIAPSRTNPFIPKNYHLATSRCTIPIFESLADIDGSNVKLRMSESDIPREGRSGRTSVPSKVAYTFDKKADIASIEHKLQSDYVARHKAGTAYRTKEFHRDLLKLLVLENGIIPNIWGDWQIFRKGQFKGQLIDANTGKKPPKVFSKVNIHIREDSIAQILRELYDKVKVTKEDPTGLRASFSEEVQSILENLKAIVKNAERESVEVTLEKHPWLKDFPLSNDEKRGGMAKLVNAFLNEYQKKNGPLIKGLIGEFVETGEATRGIDTMMDSEVSLVRTVGDGKFKGPASKRIAAIEYKGSVSGRNSVFPEFWQLAGHKNEKFRLFIFAEENGDTFDIYI